MLVKEIIEKLNSCDQYAEILFTANFDLKNITNIKQINGVSRSGKGIALVEDENRRVVVLS